MNRIALYALAAIVSASPAAAAVLGSSNVALGSSPTTFSLGSGGFAFSYDAAAAAMFNPDTYSVQTLGTGQTSAFGGFLGIPLQPSLFDTIGVTIDGNLFPSFASFGTSSSIPYSLAPGDLALRYSVGSDFYYGYARLNGDGTLNFAFESQPNAPIVAGARITGALPGPVPEASTWLMMLLGFTAIAFVMREKNKVAVATI